LRIDAKGNRRVGTGGVPHRGPSGFRAESGLLTGHLGVNLGKSSDGGTLRRGTPIC
jgi:hypothetical protein